MTEFMAALQHIDTLLKARQFADATAAEKKLTADHPKRADGWQRLGYAQQVTGDLPGMLDSYEALAELEPDDTACALKLIEAQIQNGLTQKALEGLASLAVQGKKSAELSQQVGQLYTALGAYNEAYQAYKIAVENAPRDAGALYNLASAATAIGEITEAEKLYDRVIALKPSDYDAYYNRSTLKKQTAASNHIAQMEGLLKAGIPDHKGAVQLFFALAKEYEDLGDPEPSFAHLQRGANLRASMMSYDVDADVEAMAQIRGTFGKAFCADVCAQEGQGPVFILGLPRTGTTLVDRILSSHSTVESLGEINDFALTLTRAVGPAGNKAEFIRRASDLDFTAIGQEYLRSTRERGATAPYLIDKTPANFLYLGLIAKALPTAKIIHLRRHPMDSCYAIYKTLFRMGYPYSYRLEDLARYYAAYNDLMDHWRSVLPGRFVDLDYEALVQDQEGQTQALLEACGLPFEEACLAFHKNSAPSATASAAQVRKPIHTASVGKWYTYSAQLAPLANMLQGLGITWENEVLP